YLVNGEALGETLSLLLRTIAVLERNHRYLSLNPKCEPQLGRRGLYRQTGGTDNSRLEEAMLWMLNLSDGEHSVLDIAKRSKVSFFELSEASDLLCDHDLLQRLI